MIVSRLRGQRKGKMDMKIERGEVNSILFITLSNLGDLILTTPVLERLHDEFPGVPIDVITGMPGRDIFIPHPAVRNVTVSRGPQGVRKRIKQIVDLRRRRYDLVVDLKNSLIPYVIGAKFHSQLSVSFGGRFFLSGREKKRAAGHKREEHLLKLRALGIEPFSDVKFFIPVTDSERHYVGRIMEIAEGAQGKKKVVINPGAKSHLKRWSAVRYARLADRLVSELGCRVFVTGNEDDRVVVRKVISCMTESVTDLCCKTSVGALSELMRRVDLVITNDSAPLHVASAVNAPTVAIFGPSDEQKYGPLAGRSVVVRPEVPCRPCNKALCAMGIEEGCISRVRVHDVFHAAKKVLDTGK